MCWIFLTLKVVCQAICLWRCQRLDVCSEQGFFCLGALSVLVLILGALSFLLRVLCVLQHSQMNAQWIPGSGGTVIWHRGP